MGQIRDRVSNLAARWWFVAAAMAANYAESQKYCSRLQSRAARGGLLRTFVRSEPFSAGGSHGSRHGRLFSTSVAVSLVFLNWQLAALPVSEPRQYLGLFNFVSIEARFSAGPSNRFPVILGLQTRSTWL